jgi:hypothetical protein
MKRLTVLLPCAALLFSLIAGCDSSPTDSEVEFTPTLYIEGYLVAGSPLTDIFVATTAPLYELYERAQNAVPNASVTMEVDGAIFSLQPVPNSPGHYHLPNLIIQSGKTYSLVVVADELTAQAETTVPYPPTLTASETDLQFNGTEFSASWIGDTQGGYVTTRKLEVIEAPIPIELQFGELGRFRRFGGGGGTVDTTGFGALQDSLATVRDSLDQAGQWGFIQETSTTLGWQQFQNFGTYSFHVHAIDSNYADYLASSNQDAQFLDEPKFHVTGGIGILASLAPGSVSFVIRE